MLHRALRGFLFLASSLALAAFLVVAARVLMRSDALDPVEVSVLEHAERLAHGQSLYVEPDRGDESTLMPGFPFAVSILVRLFDAGLWEPRLLALLATLLIAWLVMAIVRLETDSYTLAVAGVGSVLLGYGLLAEPPGIARPELLMLVLSLLGFYVLRVTNGALGAISAALLLACAFFTEPQAGWFLAAALLALTIDDRGRLVAFALAVAVFVGGGYVALSRTLGPWFNFSVWDAPLEAWRFRPAGPLHFVGDYLLGRLAVPTLAAVLSFAMPTRPWRGKGGLWMCMGIATLAAGLASTQSAGFGAQSLIPSVVVLALIGPISMQRVTRHLSAWPGASRLGGDGVVLVALSLQFIVFLSCVLSSPWLPGAFTAAGTAPRPPAAVASAAQVTPAS